MKQKDERDELKKLLNSSPENIDNNVPTNDDIPEIRSEPRISEDLTELDEQCKSEAFTMITNAIAFMIPIDMINDNEYLKDKLKVDVMSLSGMIYQLRLNQIVQKTLTQEISLGVTNARMFEVFTGMSKTIGELNKQLIQTVEAIKETYRSFKNDVKEQRTEALGPSASGPSGMLTTGDGSVVTRGTKELINSVKNDKRDIHNAELVNSDYIDQAGLIPNIEIKDINI